MYWFVFHRLVQRLCHVLCHVQRLPASDTDENGLSSSEAAVIDEAVAILQPAVCDEDGIWTSGYVSLRFKAHLPLDCDAGNNIST